MKFCPFCGSKISEGVKFCSECGASLVKKSEKSEMQKQENNNPMPMNPAKPKASVNNSVCPSCGMVLSSFAAICPACGREVCRTDVSSACKQLLDKLEYIEANKPLPSKPTTVQSIVKAVAHNSPWYEDPTELEQEKIDEAAHKKKIDAISNFVIPNNKKDIMEFLFLAEAKINASYNSMEYDSRSLRNVWYAKYEEVYSRALIVLANDEDFLKIKKEREEEELAERLREENRFSRRVSKKIKSAIDDKLNKLNI